jgi:hypothetical protein
MKLNFPQSKIFSENSGFYDTETNKKSAVVPVTPVLTLLLPFPLASFLLFKMKQLALTCPVFCSRQKKT